MYTNPQLDNLKLNIEKLKSFGFNLLDDTQYQYNKSILNNSFIINIMVNTQGKISTSIIDTATHEDYTLHLFPEATGQFVGQIRAQYQNLLQQIIETCFDKDIFKSEFAKLITQYIHNKYQDQLEFLWQKFPQNAIYRRKDTHKWYAALLVIHSEKIGLIGNSQIEILNLKMQKDILKTKINHQTYFPSYHMNKDHWVTIYLDGTLPIEEIYARIDESYALAG